MASHDFSISDGDTPGEKGILEKDKVYLGAFVVFVTTLLLGFIGLYAIVLSKPDPTVTNHIKTNEDDGPSITMDKVISRELAGQEHHARITMQGDMLTVKNLQDGFIAFLDKERNLLVVKNTTADALDECYFSDLSSFPFEMSEKMMVPFLVMGLGDTADQMPTVEGTSNHVYRFSRDTPIPSEYITLTNSHQVAEECQTEGKSYWAELHMAGERNKRAEVTPHVVSALFVESG